MQIESTTHNPTIVSTTTGLTPDATLEAAPEASSGTNPGASSETSPEANSEANSETNSETSSEAGSEMSSEATPEATLEATPEATLETTPEANQEADGQQTVEPGETPTSTEAAVVQEVASNDNAGKVQGGNMWIWIIVVLVVAVAAVFAVKRFVLDGRKRSRRGRARYIRSDSVRAPGDRKPAGGIDRIKATMVEDDIPVQSRYSAGYAQWIGNREDQEDACAVTEWHNADIVAHRGILAAVADGIGGLDDGQIASQTMIQSLWDGFEHLDPGMSPQDKLLVLMANGQREVVNINRRGKRCGTTLVAALVKGGYLSIISVGDSRIALYRSGVLLQLNREHVNARVRDEQSALYGAARVEGNRRAALTSYIGKEDLQELDRTLNPIQLVSGDRVLLMSDGVFGTLSDDQLVALLDQEPQQAADAIIEEVKARQKQYQDNATVVIVAVK